VCGWQAKFVVFKDLLCCCLFLLVSLFDEVTTVPTFMDSNNSTVKDSKDRSIA
jgi:hypothetical protein